MPRTPEGHGVRSTNIGEGYPDGNVRFYNDRGEPIGLDGKPGGPEHTHIPKNPDGSYPHPEGWNP